MANQILIRNSQDLADGPTELVAATPAGKVGELAVNTSSGLLFMGADPAAASTTASGGNVANVADYFATPTYTVADTHTVHGSSLDDSRVISGAASKPVYTMENAANDATSGELKFFNSRAVVTEGSGTGVTGDVLGTVSFDGMNAGTVRHNYASIVGKADSVLIANNGDETGKLSFNVMNSLAGSAAALGEVMTITGGAAVVSSTVAALGNLTVAGNLTVTGTTITDSVEVISTSTGVIFEGGTDDGHEAKMISAVAGADITYTFPNVTGHGALFTASPGTTTISATPAELNILDGCTATYTELNLIDGYTGTTAELNYLDTTTLGTSEVSKAMVCDSNGDILMPDSDKIKFGTGGDAEITWDGTNMQIGTNTNGAPIKIGHATSMVTFGDNVTVTDTLSAGTFAPATLTVSDGYDSTGLTVAAGGAVTTNGTIHADGNITTEGSFIIGSASMSETDLEKLDGITNGTAAASKALVLDADKDIGTIRNLTIDGTFSDGNYTFDTSGNVSSLGTVGCGAITSSGDVTAKTGDGAVLHLNTSLNTVIDGSVIGAINFTAPNESGGTDAIALAGAIEVVAEAAFTDVLNESEMVFKLGVSEAATAKMTLSSAGALTTAGAIVSGGAVTGSTGACYEAGGTDVAVTDGGTGLSSIAKGSILHTTSANGLAALDGGGSTDKILVYDYASDLWTVSTTMSGGTF